MSDCRIESEFEMKDKTMNKKDNWEGVDCSGCERAFGKNGVKHASSNNLADQHFCDRCNMKLIRWFGAEYGQTIQNPAKALQEREERIRVRRDEKTLKKYFRAQSDMCDELDMSAEDKAAVLRLVNKYLHLDTLPEAGHLFLTTNKTATDVKKTAA
jgi:hypothetical protein